MKNMRGNGGGKEGVYIHQSNHDSLEGSSRRLIIRPITSAAWSGSKGPPGRDRRVKCRVLVRPGWAEVGRRELNTSFMDNSRVGVEGAGVGAEVKTRSEVEVEVEGLTPEG